MGRVSKLVTHQTLILPMGIKDRRMTNPYVALMCKCFKCKESFLETELNWIVVDRIIKLICDKCKDKDAPAKP